MTTKKFNFTKAAIEALPTTDKRVFYYDTQTRGLAVLVEPSGRRTFYLYRKMGATTTQLRIGIFPDMTVSQARDQVGILNAAIVTKQDLSRVRSGKRGEMTLGEMWKWYYENHSKPKKLSHKGDKGMWEKHMSHLEKVPVSKLTRGDVRRHQAILSKDGTTATANRFLVLLSSMYTQALKHDVYTGDNPCRGIGALRVESRERRLMPHEIAKFFEALDACTLPDMRDYIYLSLFTGQRKGNVLAMRWEDISLEARLWRIPLTKNGRPLTVPLEDAEVAILERRRAETEDTGWVFPSNTKSGHRVHPDYAWQSVLDAAGIDDLRLHDLRRTLASYMVDTGASLPIIGKTLGHQSRASTEIYARLSLEPIRAAKRAALEAMRPGQPNS